MKIRLISIALSIITFVIASNAAEKTTLSQPDKDVDALLVKMGTGGNAQNYVVAEIQKMGKAAVPRLLYHASMEYIIQKQGGRFGGPGETISRETKSPNPKRLMALFLLQNVWTDEATAVLTGILKKDSNQDARFLALSALNKNARDSLKPLLPELVKDQNPDLAGVVFEQLELQAPDEDRILSLLDKPQAWKFLGIYLPRYYSPALTPKTLAMAKTAKKTDEKTAAIASLISQNANSAEIRKYISELLRSFDTHVRELSAEYLAWHGTENEIPNLETALKTESDLYSAASMTAALKAIKRRSAVKQGEAKPLPASFEEAVKVTDQEKNSVLMAETVKLLKQAESFEPIYVQGKDQDDSFESKREARMKLTGFAFDIPIFSKETEKAGSKPASADILVPPLRDYFDPARKAFGTKLSPTQNYVRIGDTVGLRQIYLTVVSIGNGEVKLAEFNPRRGYTAVIEHTGSDGRKFCSYYTHLSPFIHVRQGDLVSKGEKLGSIGRHFTWENGGYGAHLYFGIYNAAFDTSSDWPTYTTSEEFAKGSKWADPQQFILQKFRK
ncbi:MAG TPA: hypothetical protein DCZ94_03315 [Lentisphaeria bacterium]|nr:MAG: hypothetical protein A2X48_03980 [Lentisphaerae bacterium GWF2_49_21]HBC85964.1 hypothetical protein [Lentisphaeria bacterium]